MHVQDQLRTCLVVSQAVIGLTDIGFHMSVFQPSDGNAYAVHPTQMDNKTNWGVVYSDQS